MTNYSSIRYAGGSGGGTTVYADMNALIAATGTDGAQAFVQSNNNIYVYAGSGWYKIATVQNDSPSAITGVSGSYSLKNDGTPTVITAVSTDPEGFPLTWSYTTSGLGSIATVSQADNVFTITPSTDEANVGTFTLTINATDGVNGAVSTDTIINLVFTITNSNYTTLLATAVDTSTNNVFTDSSTNNHTVTGYGNVYAGAFSPYRHGGYALNFNGSSHYIRADEIGDALGTGDFSVSMWVYPHSMASGLTFVAANAISDGSNQFNLMTNEYIWNTAVTSLPTEWADNGVTVNKWSHIAVERDSTNNTLQIWANGNRIAYETNLPLQDLSNDTWMFGAEADGANGSSLGNWFDGYMYDIKVSNAVVYGDYSSITVPTEVSQTDANTVFRLSTGSIFDQSTSPISFTLNYDHFANPPFDYSETYSIANHGGSVYFDGSGDYLRIDTALDGFTSTTDPWTMEAWVNPSRGAPSVGSTINDVVFGVNTASAGGNIMLATTGTLNVGTDQNYSIKVANNAWSHLALVYNGTALKVYVNGKLSKTNTWTPSTALSNCTFAIGTEFDAADGGTPGNYYQGYISDIRVLPTEHYTGEFIPPSAPLSSTGASLHIKCTDASIIDKSQTNNLTLVGNTTGSTTQVKFAGSNSMYFDGTGDYIRIGNNKDILDSFINNNEVMTVEGWVYPTLSRAGSNIYESPCILNIGSTYFNLGLNNLTPFFYWWTGAQNSFSASNPITLNAWSHIALVLDANTGSNNLKLYVNGNLDGQGTFGGISWASASEGDVVRIGLGNSGAANSYFPGYIQDLRITKGLARYTANFTPPTEPLKG